MLANGKPREFNDIEKSKFQRYYSDGTEIPPAIEVPSWVWITFQIEETRPTYRLYNCGTNYLRIIKYNPVQDEWIEIKLEDIPYDELYSIMWRLTLKNESL